MSAALDPRAIRIGQISINAKDLERATAFYRDRLGLQHLFTVPKMAFFDCHGVRLMVGVAERPEFDHPSSILYFVVRNIEGTHAAMASEGVPFESAAHKVADLGDRDLWLAFFRDTEGNLLALMEEKPHAS